MVEFETEEDMPKRKINLKKIIGIITIFFLIIITIVLYILYNKNEEFRIWTNRYILEKETYQGNTINIKIDNLDSSMVYAYDKYIAILHKKNIELYNMIGNKETSIAVEINSPIFKSRGRYLAVAEKGGKKIYLIADKKILWENEIEGKISDITVNKNGFVAVSIADTTYKTVINTYNSKGKKLFKVFLANTRVTDMSISSDSKYLALAEVDTTGTLIQSNVKIYSIEDAQKDTVNAIKKVYSATKDKLITNIEYQNKLVCMYNDSIDICSNTDKNTEESTDNKELINTNDKKMIFMSINLENCVISVEEKTTNAFNSVSYLSIINSVTEKETNITIDEIPKQVYTCGNKIILNLGTELEVYNTDAKKIKRYISSQEINNIVASNNIIGIVYKDKIEVIDI